MSPPHIHFNSIQSTLSLPHSTHFSHFHRCHYTCKFYPPVDYIRLTPNSCWRRAVTLNRTINQNIMAVQCSSFDSVRFFSFYFSNHNLCRCVEFDWLNRYKSPTKRGHGLPTPTHHRHSICSKWFKWISLSLFLCTGCVCEDYLFTPNTNQSKPITLTDYGLWLCYGLIPLIHSRNGHALVVSTRYTLVSIRVGRITSLRVTNGNLIFNGRIERNGRLDVCIDLNMLSVVRTTAMSHSLPSTVIAWMLLNCVSVWLR